MGRKIPHLEAGTMNCPLTKMNNLMWPQACHLNSLLYCLILADWGKKISPDDLYLKSNHAHVIKQNKARNCKMQKRIKTMTEVTHKIHNFTCPERLMLTWWTTSFCSFALFFFFFLITEITDIHSFGLYITFWTLLGPKCVVLHKRGLGQMEKQTMFLSRST